MKKYQAKKSIAFKLIILGILLLPVIIYFLAPSTFREKPFILLPLLVPIIFSLLIYFSTYYAIENHILIFKSGVIKGKVDIHSITEIVLGVKKFSDRMPALSTRGFLIKFNRMEEIFIAPENPEALIQDLKAIHPHIQVRQMSDVQTIE